MFQTWKIYLFTRNKTFVVFLAATSLAGCGLGITVAVKGLLVLECVCISSHAGLVLTLLVLHRYPKLAVLQPLVEAEIALQCAVDVMIACEIFLGGLLNSNLMPHTSHTHLDIVQIQNKLCAHG